MGSIPSPTPILTVDITQKTDKKAKQGVQVIKLPFLSVCPKII
jgi:hypothetical protein